MGGATASGPHSKADDVCVLSGNTREPVASWTTIPEEIAKRRTPAMRKTTRARRCAASVRV